jgi:hypothetical protein
MPVFRYFSVAGSALLALLFVTDAYFGDAESRARFDPSLFDSTTYVSRHQEVTTPYEFRYSRDMTPANRVRDVFAQFVPSEAKRGKRYSAAASVIIVR